jgi:hypothetical protein
MTIIRGQKSIGLTSGTTQQSTLPLPEQIPSLEDEVARLFKRFENLETLVERKADNNTIRSAIRISPEAILLEAQDVGVLGTFTVADIINEQNGTTTGAVPLSITQIRGDVIRTGTILSNNWGTTTGTSINLNTGEIQIGGSADPALKFLSGNLTISGSLTASSLILTNNRTLGQIATAADAALPSASFGSTLQSSLDAGVNNIIAGMSGDYRLNVGTASIIAKHKDANEAGLGSGYSGTIRTGLIITANGIAMGYNRTSDGAWVNAVSVGSTGNVTILGTLTAGSVVAGSVTVDAGGPALSTVNANATTGAQISNTLLISGTAVLKGVIQPDTTGAVKVGTITWNTSTGALTGGTGVAITQWGIIGAASGSATFSINASTGAATFAGALSAATGTFSGDISAASGTFAGNLVTAGQVSATGTTSSSEGNACIVGASSTNGVRGGVFIATNTPGAVGLSSSSSGLYGKTSATGSTTPGVLASSGAGGFAVATETGSIIITATNANMIIGPATNTGANNLVIKEGASGSRLNDQMLIYGHLSADSKTTLGLVVEQDVETGTGSFTGIVQLRVQINGVAYKLPLEAY